MKKISINALCIIIIAILATNILTTIWSGTMAFLDGWKAADNKFVEQSIPLNIQVPRSPDMRFVPTDTATLDGDKVFPAIVKRATIFVPSHESPSQLRIFNSICMLGQLVLLMMLIAQFIKFIVNINKGLIFEYVNVVHLRRFGIYLILIALLQCAIGLCDDYSVRLMGLTNDGLPVTSGWSMPWTDFLFGCLALLMAQIWTRGLRMREEQDLTI